MNELVVLHKLSEICFIFNSFLPYFGHLKMFPSFDYLISPSEHTEAGNCSFDLHCNVLSRIEALAKRV